MNTKTKTIIKYLLFALLFAVLKKAQIANVVAPFYFGLFFALIWANQNIYATAAIFCGVSVFFDPSFANIISTLSCALVMMCVYIIHQRIKKPIKQTNMLFYSLLSLALCVFMQIYTGTNAVVVFSNTMLCLLYMFCLMKVFESYAIRGFFTKTTLLQSVCIGIFIASVFCGLRYYNYQGFEFAKLFAVFCVLVCAISLPILETLFVSCCVAVGTMLFDFNPYLVTPILLFALFAVCFKGKHKTFSILSVLVLEFLNVFMFNFYYSQNYLIYLPVCIVCVVLLCIKTKYFAKISAVYSASFAKRNVEVIINRNRADVCEKLKGVSNVFKEMNCIFKNMICSSARQEDLNKLFRQEILQNVCENCSNKNKCHKIYKEETETIFENLCAKAMEKGKINLLDIPSILATRCKKINQICNLSNTLVEQYKNYSNMVEDIDASKLLISDQFYGISTVLDNLGESFEKSVHFENGFEKQIVEELLYHDIVCSDAIVFQNKMKDMVIALEVKKEQLSCKKIEAIVSKIVKTKMFVESQKSSLHSGFEMLQLKIAPKCDIVFGTSAICKNSNQKNGDSFSILRMPNNQILMAISDGMGNGESAKTLSNSSIGLVENFYKAGFSNDIILSSLNKFLALNNTDSFATLDLCIINLNEISADFVKLGASQSIIKKQDTVLEVECNALPLGILQKVTPTISSHFLNQNDFVVLCSDGVCDSFENNFEFADFVNNTSQKNPQEVADVIMDRAVANYGGVAKDDMTVLVAKLFASV